MKDLRSKNNAKAELRKPFATNAAFCLKQETMVRISATTTTSITTIHYQRTGMVNTGP